jgi:cbb3-type cytochrome c oxidase subunit III
MLKSIIYFSLITISAFAQSYEPDLLNGKNIYEETCISCHGIDGKANTNMNLVVKPRDLTKTLLDKTQIHSIIKDGTRVWGSKSDIMAAFKYVYDDEELMDVTYYIYETFSKNTTKKVIQHSQDLNSIKEADLKIGKKIFKRNCSLCHGIDGSGESEYVEKSKKSNNFIYPYNLQKIILTKQQIFLYTKFGGKFWGAHKSDMPSWQNKYNDFQLKSVAQYVDEVIKKK